MCATLTPSPTQAELAQETERAGGDDALPDSFDLGSYRDDQGRPRALIARRSGTGAMLVIDQDTQTLGDRRLVAHLAADEPAVNARIVAELYLADPGGRFARALQDRDWIALPDGREPPDEPGPPDAGELRDARGRRYRLAAVDEHRYGRQTRWLRRGVRGRSEAVTLRTVVGALEAYEPAPTLTRAAVAQPPRGASTEVLARELRTLERSPLVLNRALREAVHRRVRSGELSLSCIASRCGRAKRRATGLRVGDTTWLQRRLGAMPENGTSKPTPWIHTDVLALIAREGLGVEPREVELANAPDHHAARASPPDGGRPAARQRPPRPTRTAATGAAPGSPPGVAHRIATEKGE
jgi:hypothetical protein